MLHDNPFGKVDIIGAYNRFLVKLSQGAHEEFFWLDITAFNLAYWLGNTDEYTFVLNSHVPPASAPAGASHAAGARWRATTWRCAGSPAPSSGVALTRVYRANPPDYLYTQVAELPASQSCFRKTLPGGWYGGFVYAATAVTAGRAGERLQQLRLGAAPGQPHRGDHPAGWAQPDPGCAERLCHPGAGRRRALPGQPGLGALPPGEQRTTWRWMPTSTCCSTIRGTGTCRANRCA